MKNKFKKAFFVSLLSLSGVVAYAGGEGEVAGRPMFGHDYIAGTEFECPGGGTGYCYYNTVFWMHIGDPHCTSC